jgi:hypothetical protein
MIRRVLKCRVLKLRKKLVPTQPREPQSEGEREREREKENARESVKGTEREDVTIVPATALLHREKIWVR